MSDRNRNYFSPMSVTGVIFGWEDGQTPQFAGTCFLYGEDDLVMTAGHCATTPNLLVRFPWINVDRGVTLVDRHPTADIALLRLDDSLLEIEGIPGARRADARPRYAFSGPAGEPGFGVEVMAFGYPGERTPIDGPPQQPRLFRGHVQSFYPPNYFGKPHLLHELSFPAPAGLSGGPVMRTSILDLVAGVVTDNVDVETEVSRTEYVEEGGEKYRDRIVRHVSYGIMQPLEELSDWLGDRVASPHILGDSPTG